MIKRKMTIFFFVVSFVSCQKEPSKLFQVWEIDSYLMGQNGISFESCLKSRLIMFRDDGSAVIPGFERPLDDGIFNLSDQCSSIYIQNQKECYFKGEFDFILLNGKNSPDTLLLKSKAKSLSISCHSLNFRNGVMDIDFFEHVLDTATWSTSQCDSLREVICN